MASTDQFLAMMADPLYSPKDWEILKYRDLKKEEKVSLGEGMERAAVGFGMVMDELASGVKSFLSTAAQGDVGSAVASAGEGLARGTMDLANMAGKIDQRLNDGRGAQMFLDSVVKVPSDKELKSWGYTGEKAAQVKEKIKAQNYIQSFKLLRAAEKTRELARKGEKNLVPFLEALGEIHPEQAEMFSTFLDLTVIVPGGLAGKVGAKGIAKGSQAAGKVMEGLGSVAKAPQNILTNVTDKVLDVAGMADTPALGKHTIATTAQAAGAIGLNPMLAAPALAYGTGAVLEQAGKWAGDLGRTMDNPSLADGTFKRVASQAAGGFLEGTAVGGALGWAADGAGGFYSGVGSGAALGTGIAAPMAIIRPNIVGRSENDKRAYLNSKAPDQAQIIAEFAGTTDDIARASHLESLFPQVPVEYVRPDDWQHGDTPGFYNPDTKDIKVRADHIGDASVISEEIFHALANSEEMGKPISELHHTLFGAPDGDGGYTGGLYSMDERAALHEAYKSMIPEDARARLDSMRRSNDPKELQDYHTQMDEEVMAAHFRAVMSGADLPQIAQRFQGKRARMADWFLKSNSLRALNQWVNGKAIMESTPVPIKDSPLADRAVRDLVRARDRIKRDLNYGSEGGMVISYRDMTGPNAEAFFNVTKDTGIWQSNPDGSVRRGADGKPKLKSDRQIKKEEKLRGLAFEGALARVSSEGGLEAIKAADGKTYYQGTKFNEEQLAAIMAIPEDILPKTLKERILKANDAIDKWGDQLQIFYHARSKNHKPTFGLAPKWRSVVPYAMALSKDMNFRFKAIDMDAVDLKMRKYLAKKTNRSIFDPWGGKEAVSADPNLFRNDLFHVVQDRAKGVRAIEGMKARGLSDSEAALRVESIDEFLNATGATRAKNEILFRDYRVDQIEKFVPLPDAQKFPYHHQRAVDRFSPNDLTGQGDRNYTNAHEENAQRRNAGSRFSIDPPTRGFRFEDGIRRTAREHKLGKAVEVKSSEFYRDPDNALFLAEDGLAGTAVTKNGDLVSVFKHPDSQGDIKAILADAAKISTTLDAFDVNGFLPTLYQKFGFKPVARVAWNDEFAPPDWPYAEAGRPDVVLMVNDHNGVLPDTPAKYNDAKGDIPLVDYDTALEIQSKAKQKVLDSGLPSHVRRSPKSQDRTALPVEQSLDDKGNPKFDDKGKPVYKKVEYDILGSPLVKSFEGMSEGDLKSLVWEDLHYYIGPSQAQEIQAAVDSGAANAMVDALVKEFHRMMEMEGVAAGLGWYSRMRENLKRVFPDPLDMQVFTELLGATSAKTPVENNFTYSYELFTRYKRGEFDRHVKGFLELERLAGEGIESLRDAMSKKRVNGKPLLLKKDSKGKSLSELSEIYLDKNNLIPRQHAHEKSKDPRGDQFGQNSLPALRVLARKWLVGKVTPKTPQFSMNLNGASLEATIDVWAARLMRRLTHGPFNEQWRIQPKSESAVSNPDFALSQIVFREAGNRLGVNPDDLQAIVWFGEKHIWDEMGWTGDIGAFKSSFDEAFHVYFPKGRSKPRTVQEGKNIISFLQKRRLILKDIDQGDYKNFRTHLKNYEKAKSERGVKSYIRDEGISDVLKSVPRSEFPAPKKRSGQNTGRSGSESVGSRRSPASPGLNSQQSPLNNRGGLQVKFATGHSAIRVNGKSRFKVFSPLKRFLGYAKSVEDVEKLLLN
jgi:hypothetical protein